MTETTNGDEAIRLRNIVKIYRKPKSDVEVHALRGVDATFRKGEYTAIMGASGSGKSTMMHIIGCLDRPTAGSYLLEGQDVSRLDDDALSDVRGRHIGFIFQSFNLIGAQSVLENLEVPLYYQGVPADERREKAIQVARRVGLEGRLQHLPAELSGGEQQRVAIARSLINDPMLLLADEPTGNLDTKTGKLILEILDEVNESGMTILMVTHDPNVAKRCRRVLEMSDGLIASDT